MNLTELSKYVTPYANVYRHEEDNGFIVWRRATGDNVELLHIKTYQPGQGTGRTLVLAMLLALKSNPPYDTVFGFTRTCNSGAQSFYQSMGFDMCEVLGVYADGSAVLFSQKYSRLLEVNNVQ